MSVPDNIGRYRITRRLGSGAFATVWLAEDDALESSVAIKVLADNWIHQLDIRARFEQEARIMRRADSDRLVRILDIGELADGRPYLVMTYAAGGTLAERLAAGPMPVQQALQTAAEIARAVSVLHDIGVLHRDLKPSNVLFDTAGGQERVLVADLGLAKAIAHASGFTVVAGTPGYMAPEQYRLGGGLDVRADVYAIGAITCHMLTGQAPGGAKQTRPSKMRPGVPAAVDDIVLRALHRDPRRRWPSTEALAAGLDEVAGRRRLATRHRLRRVGRVPALALAAVATLALAGSGPAGGEMPEWVRVSDASGNISIAVPADWARQIRGSGWDPASVRLPAGQAPGLVVGPDLEAWTDPASMVPGVFVGVSKALGPGEGGPALPSHESCAQQPDRDVTVVGLPGRVRRWTGCAGTSVSFSEVVLTSPPRDGYGIYVQIKQVGPTDQTDQILGRLLVDRSLAPQAAGRSDGDPRPAAD
jgi:hypothetical protein